MPPLGLPGLGEGTERVPTDQGLGGGLQQRGLDRLAQRPAPPSVERRAALRRRPQPVRVRPGDGVVPGVEARGRASDFHDPDVSGQHGVQRAVQLRGRPASGHVHRSDLTRRMDTGIRAPGSEHGSTSPGEPLEGGLECALDRSFLSLDLPTVEAGPVVLERESKADSIPGIHAANLSKPQVEVQWPRPLGQPVGTGVGFRRREGNLSRVANPLTTTAAP